VLRRSLLLAAALAAVPASSLADGFSPPAELNADLTAPGGRLVISTRLHGSQTLLRALDLGREVARRSLPGRFGVPVVTNTGAHAGFAADGRTVVLAAVPRAYPQTVSHLAVLDPRLRAAPRMLTFRGDYGFDAISPHGQLLYLIQHVSLKDVWAYQVRVYDLRAGRLRPHPIVDRVEREWRMSGIPLQRLSTADGGRVYTLYMTPKGGAFVHALDAAHATARCIDLPWRETTGAWQSRVTLRLGRAGLELWDAGRVVASIDTRANRVVRADRVP
jgi:hypothetical protein